MVPHDLFGEHFQKRVQMGERICLLHLLICLYGLGSFPALQDASYLSERNGIQVGLIFLHQAMLGYTLITVQAKCKWHYYVN